jgi:NAD(P)-dependent dehydrogenase (short-subunit alcohol dehydrogenase family)|tara:strand:- start:38 stop:877 length:840 start_codon:yes stop_codon:yes gene_type:complete
MDGKVCMITGANSGIGLSTAKGLAKLGATLILVCRNKEKGDKALREIQYETQNDKIDLLLADLSSQKSVRDLASSFKTKYDKLDVLINNAGTYCTKRTFTEDGIETTFAVNHLAYFLLSNLLLDDLKASSSSRIIIVSSGLERQGKINFDDLQCEKGYFFGYRAYSQSKLANILFTYELAHRLAGTRITVNCLHPGFVKTNLIRTRRLITFLSSPLQITPEKGAETSIYLASSAEVEGITGKYFANKKETKSSKGSYDESISKRLWEVSAELTKLELKE